MATAKSNAAPSKSALPPIAKPHDLDKDFASAIDAAYGAAEKGKNTWSDLLKYVRKQDTFGFALDLAKEEFKAEEKAYAEARKRKITGLTAYRTAKSTIMDAIKFNVPLFDDKDKAKTKDQVRAEVKDKKSGAGKGYLDLFKSSINLANTRMGNITSPNAMLTAWNLAKELSDKAEALYKELEGRKSKKKSKASKTGEEPAAPATVH